MQQRVTCPTTYIKAEAKQKLKGDLCSPDYAAAKQLCFVLPKPCQLTLTLLRWENIVWITPDGVFKMNLATKSNT